MSQSDIFAEKDGIEVVRHYGLTTYLVPCKRCGKIVRRRTYNPKRKNLCEYCELVYERKCEAIEQEIWDLIKTPKAIEIAKKRTERYDSIPEVLVAIELIKLGYSIIPQQRVGRYRVDFAIPAEKLIIEVDGGLYHPNGPKAGRDGDIQLSLGLDWKILHIPADWISNHIKMLKKVIIAGTSDNREK